MSVRGLLSGLLVCFSVQLLTLSAGAIERGILVGAREAALAQAVTALSGNFTIFNNQAFLVEAGSPALAISYRQPYLISGYNECGLSLVYPTRLAVLAAGVTQSAIANYRESTIGISIARELSGKLSAGLLFNWFFLNFSETSGSRGSLIVDGGVRYQWNEKLKLGFHLKNIASSKIETFQYRLAFPLIIRGGASLLLTERILLAGEIFYEKGFGSGVRLGTEVILTDNFQVRGGLVTNPIQHSFGFGYLLDICQLDFAMVHHELLGYSPTISFSFFLK